MLWLGLVSWTKQPRKQELGRWLGPTTHDLGQGLAYYVLADTGKVQVRSTVSPASKAKSADLDTIWLMAKYTESMESIIGNISNATQQNYEDCDVNPYRNLFELNEEEINMNEYDDNDNQIIQP